MQKKCGSPRTLIPCPSYQAMPASLPEQPFRMYIMEWLRTYSHYLLPSLFLCTFLPWRTVHNTWNQAIRPPFANWSEIWEIIFFFPFVLCISVCALRNTCIHCIFRDFSLWAETISLSLRNVIWCYPNQSNDGQSNTVETTYPFFLIFLFYFLFNLGRSFSVQHCSPTIPRVG